MKGNRNKSAAMHNRNILTSSAQNEMRILDDIYEDEESDMDDDECERYFYYA